MTNLNASDMRLVKFYETILFRIKKNLTKLLNERLVTVFRFTPHHILCNILKNFGHAVDLDLQPRMSWKKTSAHPWLKVVLHSEAEMFQDIANNIWRGVNRNLVNIYETSRESLGMKMKGCVRCIINYCLAILNKPMQLRNSSLHRMTCSKRMKEQQLYRVWYESMGRGMF